MDRQSGSQKVRAAPFSWDEVWASKPVTIHGGPWGNSTVLRARIAGGEWAIKTYRNSPWVYRITMGRFWTGREYRIVSALQGIAGIPANPCLLDAGSFCCGYEEGRTLLDIRLNPVPVEKEFFLVLERTVRAMHDCGFCHLDLRNGRNILMRKDGSPLLLDFQSCLSLRRLPGRARNFLANIDLSGVYKWWNRLSPETMDRTRFALLQTLNRRRVLWPFKGYGTWLRVWRADPVRMPRQEGG